MGWRVIEEDTQGLPGLASMQREFAELTNAATVSNKAEKYDEPSRTETHLTFRAKYKTL